MSQTSKEALYNHWNELSKAYNACHQEYARLKRVFDPVGEDLIKRLEERHFAEFAVEGKIPTFREMSQSVSEAHEKYLQAEEEESNLRSESHIKELLQVDSTMLEDKGKKVAPAA